MEKKLWQYTKKLKFLNKNIAFKLGTMKKLWCYGKKYGTMGKNMILYQKLCNFDLLWKTVWLYGEKLWYYSKLYYSIFVRTRQILVEGDYHSKKWRFRVDYNVIAKRDWRVLTTFFSKTLSQFQPNLALSILGRRGFNLKQKRIIFILKEEITSCFSFKQYYGIHIILDLRKCVFQLELFLSLKWAIWLMGSC